MAVMANVTILRDHYSDVTITHTTKPPLLVPCKYQIIPLRNENYRMLLMHTHEEPLLTLVCALR